MVRRATTIRVISFLLLAVCGVVCQKPPSHSNGLLPELGFGGSDSPELRGRDARTWESLPDAPTPAQPPAPEEMFRAFVIEVRSPLTALGPQPGLDVLFQPVRVQKEVGAIGFWGKYLNPPQARQSPPPSSTSDSFIGRTCFAASRMFVMRDDFGNERLNTAYFVGVLTSSAIHAAYRPYRAGAASATFNDFGSAIGSDAGINVFHEFEPGIRQVVKGRIPKLVSEIGARISHGRTAGKAASNPAR